MSVSLEFVIEKTIKTRGGREEVGRERAKCAKCVEKKIFARARKRTSNIFSVIIYHASRSPVVVWTQISCLHFKQFQLIVSLKYIEWCVFTCLIHRCYLWQIFLFFFYTYSWIFNTKTECLFIQTKKVKRIGIKKFWTSSFFEYNNVSSMNTCRILLFVD